MSTLFWKALFAFLALPGIVAFAVPLLWLAPAKPFHPAGAVPVAVGLFLLLWTVRDFYVAGQGTLAPWSPPKKLVVTGLYRFSRNPMYIAVLSICAGWAVGFRSLPLAIYALVVALLFHLRVVFGEEPWLAAAHGASWQEYRRRVRRWL